MISKDTPLSEITLRRYEKPSVNNRELIRKLCLSLGLLQIGDSRDIIVDIISVLVAASRKKEYLAIDDLEKLVSKARKKNKLNQTGMAKSNIRRQLRKAREIFIVEKIKSKYRITEFYSLSQLFEEKIMRYLVESIRERIYEYCEEIDKETV